MRGKRLSQMKMIDLSLSRQSGLTGYNQVTQNLHLVSVLTLNIDIMIKYKSKRGCTITIKKPANLKSFIKKIEGLTSGKVIATSKGKFTLQKNGKKEAYQLV